MFQTLSCAELRVRIARVPRVSLGHFPTPLEFCPRLTEAVGGPRIFIKRDDCTGLAFGGNKTRLLEFTMARAVQAGADVVVGAAGSQSNHCRQLAAAAAKLGMGCALVLVKDHKSGVAQGNLLLDDLLGASVELVSVDTQEYLAEAEAGLVERLRREGRKPFVVTDPDLRPAGAMGYALCMAELADQLHKVGERAEVVLTCSSSATQPGLIFGNRALGLDIRVVGVAPIVWSYDLRAAFLEVLGRMGRELDLALPFAEADVVNLDAYIGPEGYGYPSEEGNAALRLMARTEGIVLDPIYSAKALAGLLDLVRRGEIGADETVVFVHTGGTPGVFAYSEELAEAQEG